MEFMLVYPEMPLKIVASEFGLTQAWLSTVVHSDAFQTRFAELRKEKKARTMLSVEDRLTGLAHQAVEKLGDMLEDSANPGFILDTTETVLDRIGFGTKSAVTVNNPAGGQVNVMQVTPEVLERANAARMKVKDIQGEVVNEKTSEVPASREHSAGSAGASAATYQEEETDRGQESRDALRGDGSSALLDAIDAGDLQS